MVRSVHLAGLLLVNEQRPRRSPARRFWLSFLAAATHLTVSLFTNCLLNLHIVNCGSSRLWPTGQTSQPLAAASSEALTCWGPVSPRRNHSHFSLLRSDPGTILLITASPLPLGVTKSRILLRLRYLKHFVKNVKYCPLSQLQTGREVSNLKYFT